MHLASRAAVARLANRHVNTVARYCVPIACDLGTRAGLYDADHCVRQFASMDERFCCIQIGDEEPCGSPTMKNAPLSVCIVHASMISEFMGKQSRVQLVRDRLMSEQESEPVRGPFNAPRAAVVYYVLVGALVKIGTTVDIKRRMNAYPPTAELLVTEPGGRHVEAQRHREFNEYLAAGKEWFHPGPRLREHIESLMERGAVA